MSGSARAGVGGCGELRFRLRGGRRIEDDLRHAVRGHFRQHVRLVEAGKARLDGGGLRIAEPRKRGLSRAGPCGAVSLWRGRRNRASRPPTLADSAAWAAVSGSGAGAGRLEGCRFTGRRGERRLGRADRLRLGTQHRFRHLRNHWHLRNHRRRLDRRRSLLQLPAVPARRGERPVQAAARAVGAPARCGAGQGESVPALRPSTARRDSAGSAKAGGTGSGSAACRTARSTAGAASGGRSRVPASRAMASRAGAAGKAGNSGTSRTGAGARSSRSLYRAARGRRCRSRPATHCCRRE